MQDGQIHTRLSVRKGTVISGSSRLGSEDPSERNHQVFGFSQFVDYLSMPGVGGKALLASSQAASSHCTGGSRHLPPGVHGVIAAEVAAPGPESRGRRWCARSGATIWTAAAQRPQLHRLSCSCSPPGFTATDSSFHSSTWMSQLMLSHPSAGFGIALLLIV